jgi:predicted dehydrogenase
MKHKKKIPVCVIGAGRIGLSHEFDSKRIKPASHVGMWAKNKNCDLVAICDKNFSQYKKVKRIEKNIKFFDDPKKMLNDIKPKIVSIATWKDTHFKITKLCILHGVKVIVLEKPLANNIKQAKEIINLIKRKKVKVLVNHRRRFDDEIIKLKKKLDKGLIGEIIQASSYYVYGLLTTATHAIDTLRYLLSGKAGEIKEVYGFKNNFKNFSSFDDKNYDAVLVFQNGLKVTLQSLDIKSYDNFDFHFYGKKGKVLITDIGRTILKYSIQKSPEHSGFTELKKIPSKLCSSRPRKQFSKLAENAIDCLNKKNLLPLCSAKDSYIDMEVINKIILSAKDNSRKKKINIK